jgi:cytochrome c553
MPRLVAVFLLFAWAGHAAAQPRPDQQTFFELHIRPVLAGTCFKCHGGEKTSGGLRVDSRGHLLAGGDSGPALVPGQPGTSLLIQAMRRMGELKMPPGKKLPEHTIADFEAWIRQGAFWPQTIAFQAPRPEAWKTHWAFQPVKRPRPPADVNGWSANPVDRFIAAGLREHGLQPAPPADKRVLLRRVYFDLIGLPPTPAETEVFVADKSPDAFARVVDRLLASPHYGERWGRHWLDVARYADTAGDNADYPIPEGYLYRDYVIDAFNADKPYDEFVREQLAGDILAKDGPPEKYAGRVVATGFLALSRRYATAPYELWHLTLEDTIDTVGQAFLGLTLRCARCHDHKFDPIANADYYALYGIFAGTRFPYAGSEEFSSMKKNRDHFVPLVATDQTRARLAKHQKEIETLSRRIRHEEKDGHLAKWIAELDRLIKTQEKVLADAGEPDDALIQRQIAELKKQRALATLQWKETVSRLRNALWDLQRAGLPADVPGAYAVSEGDAADVCIQKRGEPEAKGPIVPRGPPRFLADGPCNIPAGQSGRLQLAQWLTRPGNPLTARVIVNRIWQHHFGKGIVATPSNFGMRGEPPTHPELLDYLASYLVENGWSIKALHRLILQSKTYQMAATDMADNAVRDGSNRWYWRFERRRLDAEAIRDALLSVSGTLDFRRPGSHPFPPIASWRWTQHNPFRDIYPSNHRSVYLMTQRLQRHPYLALFDGPDTNMTTEKRASSTVPLQALFWMNSPMVRVMADAFARRLLVTAPDTEGRIRLAYTLAYARPPRLDEIDRGKVYLTHYRDELRRTLTDPGEVERKAWLSYARVLLSANEFIYVD